MPSRHGFFVLATYSRSYEHVPHLRKDEPNALQILVKEVLDGWLAERAALGSELSNGVQQ